MNKKMYTALFLGLISFNANALSIKNNESSYNHVESKVLNSDILNNSLEDFKKDMNESLRIEIKSDIDKTFENKARKVSEQNVKNITINRF